MEWKLNACLCNKNGENTEEETANIGALEHMEDAKATTLSINIFFSHTGCNDTQFTKIKTWFNKRNVYIPCLEYSMTR